MYTPPPYGRGSEGRGLQGLQGGCIQVLEAENEQRYPKLIEISPGHALRHCRVAQRRDHINWALAPLADKASTGLGFRVYGCGVRVTTPLQAGLLEKQHGNS